MNIIEMKNISKSFPGTQALDGVDFLLRQGEILSLLGENGAGKTTLMKILYGMYHPDSGRIFYKGKEVEYHNPAEAISSGICMVHQHFMLVPSFTVAENVVVGIEPGHSPFLDKKEINRQVLDLIQRFHFNLDPYAKVDKLSVGEQQRVEIIKALYRKADVIILDEPTAVLTPNEVDDLFAVLRDLRESGKSIVIITHKLKETLSIADRIMVLRDGKLIGDDIIPKKTDIVQLSEMMVGRKINLDKAVRTKQAGETVFSVRSLCVVERERHVLKDISFDLRRNEILGIAGIEGNGQSYLLESITGLRKPDSGEIFLNDVSISGNADVFIRKGLAHVPEDRSKMGLVGMMSIQDNIILGYQWASDFSRKGFISRKRFRGLIEHLKEQFQIKAPSVDTLVQTLSGGNQQKVIIARTFSRDPDIMIIAQPTRGIDVGASEYIHDQMRALRDSGKAILLVSADLDEVIKMSDRILVLCDGKFVFETMADCLSDVQLGMLMTGSELISSEQKVVK